MRHIWQIKILHRLPRPNRKTRVYFLVYTIELLVVMAGVAAGFGMNNYAEGRKERKQVAEFLNGLEGDLATDLTNLRLGDSVANNRVQELVMLMGLLKSNDTSQLETINEMVRKAAQENLFFYPASATYESVKQSGQVSLIKDFQLKSQLINLYEFQYSQLRTREAITLEDLRNKIEPMVMANYDLTEFRPLNPENLFSVAFTNQLKQMLDNYTAVLQYYREAEAKCEAIRKRVQEKKLEEDY
jgi:Family of unknown function (DUF6090)